MTHQLPAEVMWQKWLSFWMKEKISPHKLHLELKKTKKYQSVNTSTNIIAITINYFRFWHTLGTAHGHGCYFATTASYSDSYSRKQGNPSKRFMILADVITGNYRQGHQSDKSLPPNIHSLVNNTSNPTIFEIFNDCAAYPSYVIKYKQGVWCKWHLWGYDTFDCRWKEVPWLGMDDFGMLIFLLSCER